MTEVGEVRRSYRGGVGEVLHEAEAVAQRELRVLHQSGHQQALLADVLLDRLTDGTVVINRPTEPEGLGSRPLRASLLCECVSPGAAASGCAGPPGARVFACFVERRRSVGPVGVAVCGRSC